MLNVEYVGEKLVQETVACLMLSVIMVTKGQAMQLNPEATGVVS